MAIQLGSPTSVMHSSETPLAGNAEGFGFQNQASLGHPMGGGGIHMPTQSTVAPSSGINNSVNYISGMQTRGAAFSHGAAEGQGGMQHGQNGGGFHFPNPFGGKSGGGSGEAGAEGEAGTAAEDAGAGASELGAVADVAEVAAV